MSTDRLEQQHPIDAVEKAFDVDVENPVVAPTPLARRPDRIASWVGFNLDISARKEAEDALRESEARFRGTFENAETEIPLRRKDDPPAGGRGRSPQGKMFVAGAVELSPDGQPRRIRLAPIADFSAATLRPFVAAVAAPGARVVTDGWSGYAGLAGHAHDPKVVGTMAAHVVLRWTHRVFSNLKRWGLGTFHGLRRQHLKRHLDEFVFRFNRRRTPHAAFRTLLGITVAKKPATYNMLIAPEATG